MVSVSHVVKKIVSSKPVVFEALTQQIVQYPNLAEQIQTEVENELGKSVKTSAIVMALRRFAETLEENNSSSAPFTFHSEIVMKSGLSDVTFVKSPSLLKKISSLYQLVDFDKGETLNIIHGNYEITIVISEKYLADLKKELKGEAVLNTEKNLVALSMSFSKEFLYSPGVLATVARTLAWEGINVYENISTMTEVIYIVHKKDAVRAYGALERLVEK